VWTMVWTMGWCTLMIDALARRGMTATDPPPNWLRPGKTAHRDDFALMAMS